MNGLKQWRRLLENDVRDKKLALARARLAAERAQQVVLLLTGERERRDEQERAARRQGEMPDFARERLNVLLERAITRARVRVADAEEAASNAVDRLREAWRRAVAVDRLLERREERAETETRRKEQRELDEIATRRHHAGTLAVARAGQDAERFAAAGVADENGADR